MRHHHHALLLLVLPTLLALSACGGGDGDAGTPAQRLVIEPDDGRAPLLDAIAAARNNIRLTIYQITDLHSVPQTPPAPVDGIAQALIDKVRAGVSVRVIVDQAQLAGTDATSLAMQQTVAAMRSAGVAVRPSSTAFCVTHQKTFVVDGPAAGFIGAGRAIVVSFNMMPGYFGGTRDYAVITEDPGVVQEAARVFDSDFTLPDPPVACAYTYSPASTYPPPGPADTPALDQRDLLWSPVNSKERLLGLIAGAQKSLDLTTEVLSDDDSICTIRRVAQSATRPTVRLLLSGDTGSNAAAVKTLQDLGLPNLSIRVMPGLPAPANDPSYATPLYMHGKQVIVDGTKAFVGSENLTNTSLIQNRELGTFIADSGMIARLAAAFIDDFTVPGRSLPASVCASGTSQCVRISCPES
jgi:phosphatidylserine/phosphatidylglycerophosphate/cardiolipin synthase-like enzyme